MTDTPRAPRRWPRLLFRLLTGLVAVALLLVAVIHAPPARRYALRRAIDALRGASIHLQADDLSYNLLALRVSLSGLRVAALSSPDVPFFTARRLAVELPASAVLGPLTIESIAVDEAAVRIVRDAEGNTNLPEGGEEGGEPEPLRIGTLTVTGLAVEVSDRGSETSLRLPAIDLSVSTESGRLTLRQSGRLSRGAVQTRITDLRGGVAFDGRQLLFQNLLLRSEELALAIDGTLALLVPEPHADLRVHARADAAGLARWAEVEDPPSGAIELRAEVDGPLAAPVTVATLQAPSLVYRGTEIAGVDAAARITTERVDVERLQAAVANGRLTARAALPMGTGDAMVSAAWDGLDLEALAAIAGAPAAPRPTGRTSGSIEARGPIDRLPQWTADVDLEVGGGRTARDRVAIAGRLNARVADGQWRAGTPQTLRVAGLPIRVDLAGRIDPESLERTTVRGDVALLQVPAQQVVDVVRTVGLAAIEAPEVEGTLEATAAVSGTWGNPVVGASADAVVADVAPLAPGTPLAGRAEVSIESDLKTARVRANLPELTATAEGTIDLQAPYPADVTARIASLTLERALRGVETPLPITGTLIANARVIGPLEAWQRGTAELELLALEAQLGELPVRTEGPVRLSVNEASARLESLAVRAGELRVTAEGRLPLTPTSEPVPAAEALQVMLHGDLSEVVQAVAATKLVEMPEVSGTGPATLLARISGSAQQPRIAADLEVGPGTVQVGDLPAVTGVALRLHSDGTWIDLQNLSAEWQGSTIAARGRAPAAWTGFAPPGSETPSPAAAPPAGSLSARITSMTPQLLAPFVEPQTLDQVEGSLDATIELRSTSTTLEDVTGELRLDRMDIRLADLPVSQTEPTRIAIRNGFAQIEAFEWTGQGATLGLRGQVNLIERQTALLADGRVDLRMLTPFTRPAGLSVAGTLSPRLSITGPLDGPRIDGVAALGDAELRLNEPRVIVTDLDGDLLLTRTEVRLRSMTGTINGGSLAGSGAVALRPEEPIEAALDLLVRGMALEFPEGLRSDLDAKLALTLTVPPGETGEPEGSLTGTVTVQRAAYREPLAVATGLLTTLRTQRLAAAAAPEPSIADNIALDIRVLTEEDLTVDNNVGRLQLGGDLRVIGTVTAPSLSGRAELREGGELFLGRNRYVIESGAIDFANPVTIEPLLNVTATTRAGGEDITLTIEGTPEGTEVELRSTSDPDLGQADIASLLLTGRPLNEISGDEAQIVGEQAIAYLSGDVLGFASRAVGLDAIRLGGVEGSRSGDTSAVASEVDPTSRLTFTKSIGRSFDVTLSQGLRDSDAQTWIVDYRPRRQFEVRFVSDDENLRSYEFRHDVSFGAAATTRAADRRETVDAPRVAAVTIDGAGTVGEGRLRAALELEPGDELDFAEWQRDRDRLEGLLHREGFYEARVTARRAGEDQATLAYEVVEGPRAEIQVSGHSLDSETMAAIRQAWIEAVFDEFLTDEVESIVRARLARDGFLGAAVDASLAAQNGSKTLRVQIEPGNRVEQRSVRFAGVEGPLQSELDTLVAEAAAGGPTPRQATEDPGAFEAALTAWLRTRGYLRAEVSVGRPEVNGSEAVVPVRVVPGPLLRVAAVDVRGATSLERGAVNDAVELSAGDAFDPAAVDAARERLQARYRREGFSSARVQAETSVNESASDVRVALVVNEGPRDVVRDVAVAGNRAIDTDVIVRSLELPVGQTVTTDAWLQARRRLFATGLFRRVDVTTEPIETAAADDPGTPAAERAMRVRVVVQEWPALRLRYGFLVAEERPEGALEGRDLAPGVSADLTRRTLFGRALTLGAALDYQRRQRRARGFVTAPTMLGLPVESSLILERSRREFRAATLVTDATITAWEQRTRVTRDLQLSYGYRFERNRTFDTDPLPGDPFVFDLTVDVAALNVAAAWDTRDDVADTTRGFLLSSSFDYAPAALGSDFRFVKHLAQAYYFRPWRQVVFASAARLGLASPLDGQELVVSERYFSGGARTVRGVEDDTLGPRDLLGDPAGGESVLILNQELRFPIYRWLRGVGFLDAGNVFPDTTGVALGDLTGAYGVGLRLTTPFALLRVDYGRLFSPRAGENGGRWMFGVGQAF